MIRPLALAAVLGVGGPAWAATDVFVCSTGWTTETTDIHFRTVPGCVEAESVAFGAVALVTSAPGLPPSELGPLVVRLPASLNTGPMLQAAASGTPLPDLTVYGRFAAGTSGTASQYHQKLTLVAPVIGEARMDQVADDVPMLTLVIRSPEITWSWWAIDTAGMQIQPPSTIHWTWPHP